jgi:hypothetical protein
VCPACETVLTIPTDQPSDRGRTRVVTANVTPNPATYRVATASSTPRALGAPRGHRTGALHAHRGLWAHSAALVTLRRTAVAGAVQTCRMTGERITMTPT